MRRGDHPRRSRSPARSAAVRYAMAGRRAGGPGGPRPGGIRGRDNRGPGGHPGGAGGGGTPRPSRLGVIARYGGRRGALPVLRRAAPARRQELPEDVLGQVPAGAQAGARPGPGRRYAVTAAAETLITWPGGNPARGFLSWFRMPVDPDGDPGGSMSLDVPGVDRVPLVIDGAERETWYCRSGLVCRAALVGQTYYAAICPPELAAGTRLVTGPGRRTVTIAIWTRGRRARAGARADGGGPPGEPTAPGGPLALPREPDPASAAGRSSRPPRG